MKIDGFGNILFVKNFARASQFYEGVFGLTPSATQEGWRQYSAGNSTFALHEIPAEFAANIDVADPPVARGNSAYKPVFRVNDVNAARKRADCRGCRVAQPGC